MECISGIFSMFSLRTELIFIWGLITPPSFNPPVALGNKNMFSSVTFSEGDQGD